MTDVRQCPHCGAAMPPDAPDGVCPRCLLGLAFVARPRREAAGADSDSPPTSPFTPSGRFAAPPAAALAVHFPQLEIVELLGQGGMGAVYKARQPRLDRLVALKVLPPEVGLDPSFAERFLREARALARLSHQHIVTVHDFGQVDDLYYFVMEFVDGANLRHLIAERKLEPRAAVAIVPQVCEALQYAHDEGVVHRDIKPENILIDRRGRVKIADFGLAKLLNRDGDGSPSSPRPFTLTGSQQVVGTPHYMAPEQMERPLSVDHRADIYSLGVVFYEMLTGELPLGRFASPSEKVQLDVRLDQVVLRSLEKEPERRYQQASQVKTDVEHISHSAQPERIASDGNVGGWPEDDAVGGLEPRAVRKLRAARGKSGTQHFASLAIAALCFFLVFLFFAAFVRMARVPAPPPVPLPVVKTPALTPGPMMQPLAYPSNWILGPGGPYLSVGFARYVLHLDSDQMHEVNKILHAAYEEYLRIEAEHSDRQTNDSGHLVVTVRPIQKPIAQLEDRLWSRLDEILDARQESVARLNLYVIGPREQRNGFPISVAVRPGLLGWGKQGAVIEIWRVGAWYHWKVRSGGMEEASSGPELPDVYRRFWKEPRRDTLPPPPDERPPSLPGALDPHEIPPPNTPRNGRDTVQPLEIPEIPPPRAPGVYDIRPPRAPGDEQILPPRAPG